MSAVPRFALVVVATASFASMVACTVTPPPPELLDARVAYARAADGPARKRAPRELAAAKAALERAEDSYQRNGAGATTRDLAYIADRKARLARSRAETLAALREGSALEAQLSRRQHDLEVAPPKAPADEAMSALQARVSADATLRTTLEPLLGLRATTEPAGLRVDVRGAVFVRGKAALSPTGRRELAELARVLRAEPRNVVVRAVGGADGGATLARARAEAVRRYLTELGVPESRLTVETSSGAAAVPPEGDGSLVELLLPRP